MEQIESSLIIQQPQPQPQEPVFHEAPKQEAPRAFTNPDGGFNIARRTLGIAEDGLAPQLGTSFIANAEDSHGKSTSI